MTPGLDRRASRLADRGTGLVEFDPRDPGAALGQRRERDLDPRGDRPADVRAVGRDRVEVDPGAEVDHDAGGADPRVRCDRVDQPVGADLVRIVDPDRHPGLHPGPDHQAGASNSGSPSPGTRRRAAVRPRRRRSPRPRASRTRSGEEARDPLGELVARRAGAGLKPPVIDELERRKAPRCVCVLPTSMASSIGVMIARSDPRAWRPELYVIPGSHPARTAAMMLERKGIPYKRVDLMPVISKGALRAVGFPGITVPALKIDGRKVQGTREIARELDRLRPEPPLFPADPERRAAVESAERWGDQTCNRRPPDSLERPAARPIAARLLLRGRAARGACRPRREDGPAAGRPLGAAQRSHRRERPRRSRGAARDAAADRRLDRRRACSGVSSRTLRTFRSRPRCGC